MRIVSFLVSALLLLAAGCGGSSGGPATPAPTTPADAFAGSYFGVTFTGVASDPMYTALEWGAHDSDGNQEESLTDAHVFLSTSPPGGETATGVMRLFVVNQGMARRVICDGFTFCMDGGITSNGEVLAQATAEGGDDPAFRVLVRPGAGETLASLAGDYHLMGYGHQQSPQRTFALLGEVTLDGAGGGSITFVSNSDGTIGGPASTSATFSVAPDGMVTFSFSPADFEGAALAGGDLILLAGDTSTTTLTRGVLVLVRKSVAASTATFSGRYQAVTFAQLGGVGWDAYRGVYVADGGGSVSEEEEYRNGDGQIIEVPAAGASPYTVLPDGVLDHGREGAVTPDGRFAVVVQMTATLRPSFRFLVRISP